MYNSIVNDHNNHIKSNNAKPMLSASLLQDNNEEQLALP